MAMRGFLFQLKCDNYQDIVLPVNTVGEEIRIRNV